MDSIKRQFVTYTIDNYNNLVDKNIIKFKGRKSSMIIDTNDFNPENYIILSKLNNSNNYTAIVNKNYKLIFDQNYNIIGYINKFNNIFGFQKKLNINILN